MYFTNLLIFFYFFEPDASLQPLIKPPFLPSHRTHVPVRMYQKGKCQSIIQNVSETSFTSGNQDPWSQKQTEIIFVSFNPSLRNPRNLLKYHDKCQAPRRSHAAGMPGHGHGQEHDRRFGSRCSTVLPTSGARWDTSPKKFLKLPQLNSPDVISFVAIRLCLLFHILIKTTQTKIICLLKTLFFFLKNCLFHPLPLPLGAVSIARDITRQLCCARPAHNNNCTRASQPEARMLKPN